MKIIKCTFLISAIFTQVFSSQAQTYEPVMGQDSTSFYLYNEIIDAGFTIDYEFNESESVEDKIHWLGQSLYGYEDIILIEDTLNSQLFLNTNNNDTTDYLIYDMSLELGDTFYLQIQDWGSTEYIIVESVYEIENRKNIVFNVIFPYWPTDSLRFVEGIGPNAFISPLLDAVVYTGTNLNDNEYNYMYSGILNCKYKDGVEEYRIREECNYYWTNIQEKQLHTFQILSNIINGQEIIISNKNPQSDTQIIISNINGSPLISSDIYLTHQSIDVSSLSNGLYMASFVKNGQILKSEKFVIEN